MFLDLLQASSRLETQPAGHCHNDLDIGRGVESTTDRRDRNLTTRNDSSSWMGFKGHCNFDCWNNEVVRALGFQRVRFRPWRDMVVEFVGSLLSQVLVFGETGEITSREWVFKESFLPPSFSLPPTNNRFALLRFRFIYDLLNWCGMNCARLNSLRL